MPASLATVLTGFIVLTTRRKAITQVAGYLILENGIFIMGLTLVEAMPFLVEVGVLLDLVVGIFVMGIMIYQINREFSSLDTDAPLAPEGVTMAFALVLVPLAFALLALARAVATRRGRGSSSRAALRTSRSPWWRSGCRRCAGSTGGSRSIRSDAWCSR